MSNELKAIESHLNDSAHHEEAEAFMEVDWYVSEYLRCPKSDLHDSAFELRKLVGDIVESWNSRPTEAKKKCYWTDQSGFDMDGTYDTSCKEMWAFTQDGIKENGITYCPFCGCTIVEVEK